MTRSSLITRLAASLAFAAIIAILGAGKAAAANTPPIAAGGGYQTKVDEPLVVNAPGVLAGATDAELDPLTAALAWDASNGKVELAADGSFTYTPNPGFSGKDNFGYNASDGTDTSNDAMIEIWVASSNIPPMTGDFELPVLEDGYNAFQFFPLYAWDPDSSGTVTIDSVSDPMHGSVKFDPATGDATYTPDPDYFGPDVFTFVVSDGTDLSAPGTVTVDVWSINDRPIPSIDDGYSTTEGQTLTVDAPGVLGNDVDPEGDALTAKLTSDPTHGVLDYFNADGSFQYTPSAGFAGYDEFYYNVSDGTDSVDWVYVAIKVERARQHAPVAADDAYKAVQDHLLIVDGIGQIYGTLNNDVDSDGDPLTVTNVVGPSHGTLWINALGNFEYQPAPGFTGVDSFTYQATDGTSLSNVVTVTITVDPARNTAPVAAADFYSVKVGNKLVIGVAGGVLANDSDADGDALNAKLKASPSHGTLDYLDSDGSFAYTPDPGFVGVDKFTYQATDGTSLSNVATVTIKVNNNGPKVPQDPPCSAASKSTSHSSGGTTNGSALPLPPCSKGGHDKESQSTTEGSAIALSRLVAVSPQSFASAATLPTSR